MSELPQGWADTTLGDIVTLRGDKVDPAKVPEQSFIGLEDIEPHTSAILRVGQASEVRSSVACFKAGDVLYSRLRPYLNKVTCPNFSGVASAEILVLQPNDAADAEFVRRTIMTRGFLDFTAMLDKGDRPRVSYDEIADFAIPLPPLPEQRRIVAKIDSLTGKSKRARDHLDHIPRLVEKYKQAILAAAFQGDLTQDWRSENREVSGKYEANIPITDGPPAIRSRVKKTAALTPDQTSSMWDGPHEWKWGQVGDCAFVTKLAGFEYTKHVKYESSGDLRVIKAENAGPYGFRETAYSRVSSDSVSMLSRSQLFGGELLVVFVGAGTGNVAVVPEADDFFLGPNIAMVRPHPEAADSHYLEFFFRSSGGKQLLLATSKAVAQPSLSMGAIRSTPVLLPSIAEQAEIVRRIESAFNWIDRVATDATSARKLIDHLDQAVLAKAFRGELVPQDPADEPASVLLDRIRAERVAAPKPKRGRRKAA